MTLTFGFYNSVAHDRQYDSTQISALFDGLIRDGVFISIGSAFAVTPGGGLTVSVAEGRAWFNHTWSNNDAPVVLEHSSPDLLLPRIDTIVLEIDSSNEVRANSIKILEGTPASNPVAPTLANAGTLHQYPFADIRVPVGLTDFDSSHITNRVGTSACPFVTGVVASMNIDNLIAQWNTDWDNWTTEQEAEFQAWFDNLEAVLDENVAGNLQNEINDAYDIIRRQGGDPDDWSLVGTTNYDTSAEKVKEQVGDALANNQGTISVTFPIAYTKKPLVSLTYDGDWQQWVSCQVTSVTLTGFVAKCIMHTTTPPYHAPATVGNVTAVWRAVGPIA